MFLLSILTSKIVYKILKKKGNKENKVVPMEGTTTKFDWAQLIEGTTISNEAIELKRRILIAIGEDEKTLENEESENEGTTGTTQKTDIEIFKEFILKNAGKDGKISSVEEVTERTGLSKKQQVNLKAKLLEEGFLYKVNERTYKLNEVTS